MRARSFIVTIAHAAQAIAARAVSAALVGGAAYCSASAWGSAEAVWLGVLAGAIDMTSPFLWARRAREARIACCVAIALSTTSIFKIASEEIAAPFHSASVAGAQLVADAPEITRLRSTIDGRAAEAARLGASLHAAESDLAGSGERLARQAVEVERLRRLRDASEACASGRHQPDAANPLCRERAAVHEAASAELGRREAARAALLEVAATARAATASAAAAHAQRETRLEELMRLARADRQAAGAGPYLFRYLEERLGVGAVDVAMVVSALLALAGAMLATIAPGWLIASTPFRVLSPRVALHTERSEKEFSLSGVSTFADSVDAMSSLSTKAVSAMTAADKMAIAGEAIDAVAAGGTQRSIANKYGVSTSALSQWVKRHKAQRGAADTPPRRPHQRQPKVLYAIGDSRKPHTASRSSITL